MSKQKVKQTGVGVADETTPHRVAWPIPLYCEACDFSRATFYNLPLALRPRSVKIGKRHIIIESPADYLARLANAQEGV
jgi:hypothetical protein